jgi:Domain of unknown function (DUF4381)
MNSAPSSFAKVAILGLCVLLTDSITLRAQTTDAPTVTPPSTVPGTTSDSTPVPPSTAADASTPAAVTPAPPETTTNAPANTSPSALDTPPPQQPTPDASPASPPDAQASPQGAPAQVPPKEDIDDIRPPLFFFHWWIWLCIAAATIFTLVLFVLLWFWMKPERQLSAVSAYDLTLQKLAQAHELLREEEPKPYAVAVSEVIRGYLGQRFLAPSTRQTTEEFLQIMETDKETPLAGHRDLLRNFLESCDLVKFARYQPTLDELEEVHQRAINFVTATKPLPAHLNGDRP